MMDSDPDFDDAEETARKEGFRLGWKAGLYKAASYMSQRDNVVAAHFEQLAESPEGV
jgi:hypothetical protein